MDMTRLTMREILEELCRLGLRGLGYKTISQAARNYRTAEVLWGR